MNVIETRDLTKRYDDGDVVAVDELSFAVDSGEIFGFLGPNGAGKSTTINMLLDHVRPTSGSATILGMDVQEQPEAIRREIGVLPEGLGLYNRLTGRRHLELASEWAEAATDVEAVLDRVGLSTGDANRRVGAYSTGMRQRLALAMAVIGDPEVLILDEPSSGLDPHGIRQMRSLVREEADRGTTVFFSSHILGEVEAVCDRVGILQAGELVAIDDVDRLRRTVSTESELRLRIAGDRPVALDRLDGVESATMDGGMLRVQVAAPEMKAHIVAELLAADVDILDISSDGASLEDVFRAYTTEASGGATSDTPRSAEVVG